MDKSAWIFILGLSRITNYTIVFKILISANIRIWFNDKLIWRSTELNVGSSSGWVVDFDISMNLVFSSVVWLLISEVDRNLCSLFWIISWKLAVEFFLFLFLFCLNSFLLFFVFLLILSPKNHVTLIVILLD